ncbi:uncharacterized protein TM35_001091030 [Trypanosoma theileri]|uniref:Uncharacterized protein n=1 Tax=Trypanosoma theileri TaxID=67003 RepID=A0A1X0NDW5_9TRYP|nr:uncharacterized protein TM35_001091030 [Trypanosoma theileri]ORC81680.1 hypothetical protein TM35_001091030 [Trypanosoma theileri]
MVFQNVRWRKWKRLMVFSLGGQFLFCTMCVTYARYGKDKFFSEHWRYAIPVTLNQTRSWAFWQNGITPSERACAEAWLDAMNFKLPSNDKFASKFILQDTLCLLCNRTECANAIAFLQKLLPIQTTSYCMEIRKEKQDSVVFLHLKLETDFTMKLPFSTVQRRFIFPSIVSLQLENKDSQTRIAAAEHRWFGGPLVSFQSTSISSPWGDIGDLWRRFNGFAVSSVMGNGHVPG